MAGEVRVSFCATNLNTLDRLPSSIASIDVLGRSLGVPYEVVVADGPSTDGARSWLEARAKEDPRFRVVPHDLANRGYGRRRAFEASRGAVIVPFDTSLAYAPTYGGLLKAYLASSSDRMLFSEVCALSRTSIEAVGGWRDLVGGEDIDLYARVTARFGLVAWPTASRDSQSVKLGSYERQMRYVGGSTWSRFRRIYAVQRDQIIGTNFRVGDLMLFQRGKPLGHRALLRVFYTLTYLGSRSRPLKPIRSASNNYLLFREAILASIRRGDYRSLSWDGPSPTLLLTADEVSYLSVALPGWNDYASATPPVIGKK
jgi:glycosyltransferase involved in cell wall biosynthesis